MSASVAPGGGGGDGEDPYRPPRSHATPAGPATPVKRKRRAVGPYLLVGDSDDEDEAPPEQNLGVCLPCMNRLMKHGVVDCRQGAGQACMACRSKHSTCN
jgi:hypothetical protein